MNTLLVIDIGGTHIKFGVMENGVPRVLSQHVPTRILANSDPIIELAKQVNNACNLLDINCQDIDAVVATVPGLLNYDRDHIHFSGNIPQLNGRRLATELSAKLQIPVYLEHDVILLLQGEWLSGAGKNIQYLLGIFFGTGVGIAWLENGQAFRGNGCALEIGHIPFRGLGTSLQRTNFNDQCLENYVSGRMLETIADRYHISIFDLFLACTNNPTLAKEIDYFIENMAMATALVITLFSPQTIVVGGGVCHMAGFPYDHFRQKVVAMLPITHATLDLRRDELGWSAVLYGATVRLSSCAAK